MRGRVKKAMKAAREDVRGSYPLNLPSQHFAG